MASKFDCLFIYLVFVQKKTNCCEIFKLNQATFSISWRYPKFNFTGTIQKHNYQNIQNSKKISSFDNLSKWQDPDIINDVEKGSNPFYFEIVWAPLELLLTSLAQQAFLADSLALGSSNSEGATRIYKIKKSRSLSTLFILFLFYLFLT